MAEINYPRKYWWLILIALPVIIALINILPSLNKGETSPANSISIEGSTVEGDVQIVGSQNILNEISQELNEEQLEEIKESIEKAVNLTQGGLYKEAIIQFNKIADQTRAPAAYSNLGALYLLEGEDDKAYKALAQGISENPDYDPLHINMAQFHEKQGDIQSARKELEKVNDNSVAKNRLKQLMSVENEGIGENEPNNSIFEPNLAPLQKAVNGYVEKDDDKDYYIITTNATPRDIYAIKVKNASPNLALKMELFGADKGILWEGKGGRAQDLSHTFSVNPNSKYYIAISGYFSFGRYSFEITPKGIYDKFEPNDDIFSATTISANSITKANILDGKDVDFYKFRSNDGMVSIRFENHSEKLLPKVEVKDEEKRHVWINDPYGGVTAGQNISHELETEAGKIYYLVVSGSGSGGDYVLELR